MRVLSDLAPLFQVLGEVIGPTIRDGAIVYDVLEGPDSLPVGWTDEQAPGRYRLRRRNDEARFGYAVGPHSWKQQLFPSRESLWTAEQGPAGISYVPSQPPPRERAFLGVRACELAAMAIQDRVFLGGRYKEPRYEARREKALIIAVNCTEAGDLCFCSSMGTGPRVGTGADLVLTEQGTRFLIEARSERGEAILAKLPAESASAAALAEADSAIARCAASMGRVVDTTELPGLLFANLDHPRWKDVATRCTSCGACTSVCPTCFCSSVQTSSNLDGSHSEAHRIWDSCFSGDHARTHGADARPDIESRYRQWATHKFGSWVSQFGTSGCVGCGRCIAWCPVGIDVTAELAAIRAESHPPEVIPSPPVSSMVSEPDVLLPRIRRIEAVFQETVDTFTLRFLTADVYQPGQFAMLGLPALGESAISVSAIGPGWVEHTIRAVGAVTKALTSLHEGEALGVRGPFGSAWPLATLRGGPVVVIAGGVGLAPLRGAIQAMVADAEGFPDLRIFVGARSPDDLLFEDELRHWGKRPGVRVEVSVDRGNENWRGHVGVVTRLLRKETVPASAQVMMCGPEIMMHYSILGLRALGLTDDAIYVTMERHMKCAAGFCGRCQYAHFFLCKEGPVFRFDQLRPIFGQHGF